MAIQYYTSRDAGAPQLEVTRSESNNMQCSIIAVLDTILVTGYGAKPGFGWAKVMTSEVAGSDRTVYRNQSANDENMNLIVQSHKKISNGIMLQMADVVNSPESYEHYSDVVAIHPSRSGTTYWYAIGDERTIIFIYSNDYLENSHAGSVSSWKYNYPASFYAGDLDDPSGSYPKAWCLLGSALFNGTLDDVEAANSSSSAGMFAMNANHNAVYKSWRPVTQVPGEDWAATDCLFFLMTVAQSKYFSNDSNYQVRTPEQFANHARIKSPWFFILNQSYVFKLRGVYSIYPWITNCSTYNASSRNWLKPLDVFGEQFLAFSKDADAADDYFSPMECYVQISGEWQ